MKEHLIFYVDFLGVKSVVEARDENRISGLAELLHALSSLRGPFDFSENATNAGRTYLMRPEITTFSDHVVMSFPIEDPSKTRDFDVIGPGFVSAEKIIANIATEAIKLNLLIRGGATIGRLHHENGVVLGKAMSEAYLLESSVAIYPRVALSQRLHLATKSGFGELLILDSHDGIPHLNYFMSMIFRGVEHAGSLRASIADLRDHVSQNIVTFQADERTNEFSKWSWFKNTIDQCVAKLPPESLE
jgi:hypothetical protein